MKDPIRLLAGPLSELEREALRADELAGPPPGLKRELLQQVLVAGGVSLVAVSGAVMSGSAAPGGAAAVGGIAATGAKSLSVGAVIKGLLLGATVGLAGAGAVSLSREEASDLDSMVEAPVVAVEQRPNVVAKPVIAARRIDAEKRADEEPAAPELTPVESLQKVAAASSGVQKEVAPVDPATVENPASQVRKEAVAVASARAQLRQGRAAHALEILEILEREQPGGVLGQERALLKIMSMKQLGAAGEAEELEKEFRANNPMSPYLETEKTGSGDGRTNDGD